jgi:hypothetical protein
VGLAAGCGQAIPPEEFAPRQVQDAGTGPDVLPVFDATPQEQSCDLGPDRGVCACLDMPLLTDIPNIYFVLDRSGSMAESDKWFVVRSVIGQTVKALGPRINVGVALFPDVTQANCVPGDEVMAVRRGDSPAGSIGPTLLLLSQAIDGVVPQGGTPTAATLARILPRVQKLSGRTYVVLATDGGPNCNPQANCTVDQCIVNIEGSDPSCKPNVAPNCCTPEFYGAQQCLDGAPTIAAVGALKQAGIPTYVVGVHGSGPYAALLDQLATAGGTALATEPLYYAVDSTDASAFSAAISQIAAKITATCTLPVSGTVDPDHVNVFLDGAVVPKDPTDGWTLDGNTVTLVGATCSKVMTGQVLDVRVVSGCPTVIR